MKSIIIALATVATLAASASAQNYYLNHNSNYSYHASGSDETPADPSCNNFKTTIDQIREQGERYRLDPYSRQVGDLIVAVADELDRERNELYHCDK